MNSILGVQVAITSGCALYYDGKIVFAVSEERFTKTKNETNYPHKSIEACLEFCAKSNIPLPSLAVIPSINMDFEHFLLRRECTYSVQDYIQENYDYWYKKLYQEEKVQLRDVFQDRIEESLVLSKEIKERLYSSNNPKEEFQKVRAEELNKYECIKKVEFVNHEYSHAAYALYASPLEKGDTFVVTIDGFGDEANASIWTHNGEKMVCHKKYTNFNIGRIYKYITLLLGMKPNEHEYKVMGLAPNADEEFIKEPLSVFENTWYFDKSDGEIKCHDLPKDSYFYYKERLEGVRFDNIAGALQKYTENMIISLVDYWAKKLDKNQVVLSGGVSLNIKANMCVGELNSIRNIFVPASGGDESLCIAAIYAYLDNELKCNEIQPLQTMYLGTSHEVETIMPQVEEFVQNKEYKVSYNATNVEVARLLADGKVVGRFSGRMEFGARSLGNRAILANPKWPNIVRTINKKIKKRDFWMPFTPSILDFKKNEYLVNPKGFDFPFMTVACRTTEKAQDDIVGSLHPADFTSRPQIVTKEQNPEYWSLIDEFYGLTGVGALLNTSLNLSGLPICESIQDVFYVFDNSDIDAIYINNILIERS